MKKHQKSSISISIVLLVLFLIVSLVTQNWLFFVWSLPPVFLVLMTTFFIKDDKRQRGK